MNYNIILHYRFKILFVNIYCFVFNGHELVSNSIFYFELETNYFIQ